MFLRTYCVHASILGAAALFVQSFSPAFAIPNRECGNPRVETIHLSRHQVLTIPSKGWLLVEVMAADATPTWFDVAQRDETSLSSPLVTERGFEQGLLEVDPGLLKLRYGTVDPTLDIPIRMSTHFVAQQAIQLRDGDEGDDTEAGDGEIVPKEGNGPTMPKNPDKGGETRAGDEAGEGENISDQGAFDVSWQGCLTGEEPLNDFGICASWLEPGRVARQQLGEFRAGDRDYFAFELEHSHRVRIIYRGTVPMKGTLLLANGRPLMVGCDPSADGLDIEADLVAGAYLLRLEGLDESAGSYELSLETSSPGDAF